MKKTTLILLALLFITPMFNAYADGISVEFPAQGQTGISRTPFIKLRADYPIDVNSIVETSPFDLPENELERRDAIIYLMNDNVYYNISEAQRHIVSVHCRLSIDEQDNRNLYIIPEDILEYGESYSIVVDNGLLLLKPDTTMPGGIDTITCEAEFPSCFTVVKRPINMKSSSIDDEVLFCGESLNIVLTEPMFMNEDYLENLVQVLQIGEPIDTENSNSFTYNLINVDIDVSLDASKTILTIEPDTDFELGKKYNAIINLEPFLGENRTEYFLPFFVPDQIMFDINASSTDQSELSPNAENYLSGSGYYVEIGNSAYATFPTIVDDFYFSKWENVESEQVITSGNSLTFSPDCPLTTDGTIDAVYEPIPEDTIHLEQLCYILNSVIVNDDCSQIDIINYDQKIDNNTYTYKRYANKPLRIRINPCDNIKFDNWTSDDQNIDGNSNFEIIIDRENLCPDEPDCPSPKSIQLGAALQFIELPCDLYNYNVTVKYYTDEDGDTKDPALPIGTKVSDLIQSIIFNQVNIPIPIGSENEVEADCAIAVPLAEYSIKITLHDNDYEIAAVNFDNGVSFGNVSALFVETAANGRIGSSTPTYLWNTHKVTQSQGCLKSCEVIIRKKVEKLNIILTVDDNSYLPYLDAVRVELSPLPPEVLNNYNGLPEDYVEGKEYQAWYHEPDKVYYTSSEFLEQDLIQKKEYVFYYWKGTDVEATAITKLDIPWAPDKWSDAVDTYPTPDITDNPFEFTMDIDREIHHIFAHRFSLMCIGYMCPKYLVEPQVEVDSYGNNIKLNDVCWKYYSPNNTISDGFPKLPLFMGCNDPLMYDKYVGMAYEIPTDHVLTNRSLYHNYTGQLKFVFSHQPNYSSIMNCIEVRDGHTNYKKFVRHDGYPYQKYNPNFPLLSNQRHINCHTDAADSRVIVLDLATSNNTNEYQRYMTHMNPFTIKIYNYDYYQGGLRMVKRITRYSDGAPMANLFRDQATGEATWNLRTDMPGIHVESKSIKNRDYRDYFGGDPELFAFVFHIFSNPKQFLNIDNGDEHQTDEKGNIIYNCAYTMITDNGEPKEVDQGSKWNVRKMFSTYPALYDHLQYHLTIHVVDENGGILYEKGQEVFEYVLDLIGEELNGKEGDDKYKKLYDIVHEGAVEWMDAIGDDDTAARIKIYLDRIDKGLHHNKYNDDNYNHAFAGENTTQGLVDWNMWGAGHYNMYKIIEQKELDDEASYSLRDGNGDGVGRVMDKEIISIYFTIIIGDF